MMNRRYHANEETKMKLYVGMDLHSTNVVTQVINEEDSIIYRKKQGVVLIRSWKAWIRFKRKLKVLQ